MNTKTVYSTKAEKYAKYRWDYAPEAIEAIIEITRMTNRSILADLGAGTGILTRHFVNRARKVYAIEPNAELRQILARDIADFPSVSVVDVSAEDTRLSDQSVDVITVAQAIHWFDPEPAREEMMRILKPGGWLALLRNYGTNQEHNDTIGSLMKEEYGADFTSSNERPQEKPIHFYFGNNDFHKLTFSFQFKQNWEEFIGALTTASYMPDEEHPLFRKLKAKAKEVFSKFSKEGYWTVEGETELIIGQPSRNG